MHKLACALLCLTLLPAYAADELLTRAQQQFKPLPAGPAKVESAPTTPERVELGKMLYFDPRLSASWLVSCNTCHNVGLGGVDLMETSVGHGWQKGPRNAPTVLNAVYNIAQFWDGRAPDLKEQAKGPIQAAVEMNNSPQRVTDTLNSMPEYVQRFQRAYAGEREPLSFENVAKAIAAYEATLVTPNSRFDKFLNGDQNALSDAEKRGLALFMDKGCSGCHNGINVGGNSYQPFGVVERPGADILPPNDKGRFVVTKTPSDEYVFRVPALRNVALTAPYFHSGKVWDLKQAVGVMGAAQLGIKLNNQEEDSIVAFLQTLTGEQPKVEYPILPPITASTPPPRLDAKLIEAAPTSPKAK